MKLRNQLLALFCLLVFLGIGVLYFREWAGPQKPFGIILFIGDGLVSGNLTAARLYDNGADHPLTLESLPNLALVSNYANDFAVPDSPAAASAIATGSKVNNGSIALDPHGQPLPSILDLARTHGRAIGLVTNGCLTDATTAAFYAHAAHSNELENIAAQFSDQAKLDVALGGGAFDFLPSSNGGRRKDGRDLIAELQQKGHEILRTRADLENAAAYSTASRLGIFGDGNFSYAAQTEPGSAQPSLADMTRRAIQFLQVNRNGYLLVVDAELISRAAEQNDGEHTITETIELDRAVATALKYAGGNALIIAVGKHAIGGMALNGYPLRQEHGVGLLGTNAFGFPAIVWASGPNGPAPQPIVAPAPSPESLSAMPTASPALSSDSSVMKKAPAAFYAPTAVNTAEHTLGIGSGPGSEALRGVIDNTAIFEMLARQL